MNHGTRQRIPIPVYVAVIAGLFSLFGIILTVLLPVVLSVFFSPKKTSDIFQAGNYLGCAVRDLTNKSKPQKDGVDALKTAIECAQRGKLPDYLIDYIRTARDHPETPILVDHAEQNIQDYLDGKQLTYP